VKTDAYVVWYAPISSAGTLGYQHKSAKNAREEANARFRIYGGDWRVARLEWDRAEVFETTKPDRIVRL
jgi:hypothetical protein